MEKKSKGFLTSGIMCDFIQHWTPPTLNLTNLCVVYKKKHSAQMVENSQTRGKIPAVDVEGTNCSIFVVFRLYFCGDLFLSTFFLFCSCNMSIISSLDHMFSHNPSSKPLSLLLEKFLRFWETLFSSSAAANSLSFSLTFAQIINETQAVCPPPWWRMWRQRHKPWHMH